MTQASIQERTRAARTLICSLITALALFMHGCASQEDTAVTFAVGGAPHEIAFWEVLAKEFEQTSGIRVGIMRQPTDTDQRRQGLVIALKSKEADPDVFLMDVAWIAQLAASGWLEPLDRYEEKGIDTGTFFEQVIDRADRHHGRLIALPVYIDGGILYYRKDLLTKYGYAGPPREWPELLQYCLTVQEGERKTNPRFYGFVWQGAQYEGLLCNFLEFAASGGGGIILNGGTLSLSTPENEQALDFMHNLIHTYAVSPPNTFTEMKEEETRMFFQSGNALFERNWPYAWILHQASDSPVKGMVGIAPLPHFPSGRSVSTLGGWHIGISQYSDAKYEGFQFLAFVVSYAIQKRLALQLGWNPGRRDVYRDDDVRKKLPHFAQLEEVFTNALPRPGLPYYSLISEILQRSFNRMLSGTATARETLRTAEREAQKIVDRYEEVK